MAIVTRSVAGAGVPRKIRLELKRPSSEALKKWKLNYTSKNSCRIQQITATGPIRSLAASIPKKTNISALATKLQIHGR